MKIYVKSSNVDSRISSLFNGTPGRIEALEMIDWCIDYDDADKLINGVPGKVQYIKTTKPIIKIEYPNDALKEKAASKGANQSFIFTYDDGSKSLYGYMFDDSGYEYLQYLGRA